MKRVFLLNPSARRGRAQAGLDNLKRYFQSRGGFEVSTPRSREEMSREAARLAQEGVEQIVVLGGDGTLNAVANGVLATSQRPLLVATNWGSGSDYFRALSCGKDWKNIVESHVVKSVSVGRFERRGEVTYFLNSASVGMSAEVVQRQAQLPAQVPPLASYLVPTVTTLFLYRSKELRIDLDGVAHHGSFLNAFFMKGKFVGGGMKLGGAVRPEDPQLDVTLIPKLTSWESLRHFRRVFSGDFSHPKFVKKLARKIAIHSETDVRFELDGEVVEASDATIEVVSDALRFCVPREGKGE